MMDTNFVPSPEFNATAAKKANVDYSNNDICKTISVPLIRDDFPFGTRMTDPVWNMAATDENFAFSGHDKTEPLPNRSRMALLRTRTHLFIGWFFYLAPADRLYPDMTQSRVTVWNGDLAELHFGAMEPDPWLLQICIGITGISFDSTGRNRWKTDIWENEEGWGAEIMIPTEELRLTEGGFRFNLCRCDMKLQNSYTWSPLQIRFHEVENFGELLFDSYDNVCTMRSGKVPPARLDRSSFETLRKTWEIPAYRVTHGPYLSNPDQNSICVNWETAGKLPAFIEYRKAGTQEEPQRVYCGRSNGILSSETAHFAKLENLPEDTVFEYELFYLEPVTNAPRTTGIRRSFRTAPRNTENYTFFCVTDLHSDADYLVRALQTQEAETAAFHLLLGDNLSHAAGREALYQGIIDPIVSVQQQKTQDVPLVFIRGNHEQLGVYASEYFNVMRHPSGRTFYAFTYGKIFFICLDSGDDKADSPQRLLFSNNQLLADEQAFLREITQSPAYQNAAFRIVFIHIPPLSERDVQLAAVRPLAEAEIPPDAMFSGHWHAFARINANETAFTAETAPGVIKRITAPAAQPFPRVLLSTDNALFCEVKEDKLEFRILQIKADGSRKIQDQMVIGEKK